MFDLHVEEFRYQEYLTMPYTYTSHEDWCEGGYELHLERYAYSPADYETAWATHNSNEPARDVVSSSSSIPF